MTGLLDQSFKMPSGPLVAGIVLGHWRSGKKINQIILFCIKNIIKYNKFFPVIIRLLSDSLVAYGQSHRSIRPHREYSPLSHDYLSDESYNKTVFLLLYPLKMFLGNTTPIFPLQSTIIYQDKTKGIPLFFWYIKKHILL